MSIPASVDRLMDPTAPAVIDSEQPLLERDYAEQVADQFGVDKEDSSTTYGRWKYDVFSRDEELNKEKVIESIVEKDDSYFMQAGSALSVNRKLDEEPEIEETVELTAKTGEQNSATVNVNIPMENGIGIDSYSELGLSDEYREKAQKVKENLGGYTKAMIDRTSASGESVARPPTSEILTRVEQEIGRGSELRT